MHGEHRPRRLPLNHARTAVRDDGTLSCSLTACGERESVGAVLARNAAHFASRAVCCERRNGAYHATSWVELLDDATAFACFLGEQCIEPGDRVAVVSRNRTAMLATEFATMGRGAIYVPLFAGYSAEQTSELLDHAAPRVVILADAASADRITIPSSARAVVAFDSRPGERAGLLSYGDLIHRYRPSALARREFVSDARAVDPDFPCLMMYTSGTSGALKGVLLTHDNILSQRRAIAALWDVTPGDRFLSYLPWHHSFGGIFEKYTALYNGATIFLDDSMGRDFPALLRNFIETRPTIYFSVPKIYQQLIAHAQAHPDDDPRIFHPDLRFVFTAAAPLPENLSRFFASKGIAVVEGWGLTETAPCCTLTDPSESRALAGKVGYPIPGVTVRIAPDGEILVRGPNVMLGYYRDPVASAQALPGDGWFHTGDLGELSGNALRLVGRKDRVFKMLNAEKVVPTDIENRLAGMNKYIRHVIVTGDGRDFVAALVFPDYFRIAEEFGGDRQVAEREVKASLRATMLEFNDSHPVKYERISAFAVISEELSIEEGDLTPSLKVRVKNVLERSRGYVDAVYEPGVACECRYLRKVLRLSDDPRRCFAGRERTLSQCHECGAFIFDEIDRTERRGELTS
ncbi:MAG TPA: AMP-binding protein [Gemmatimonadaceae bacterium]|nr:AMP-binding protein [Gemmatimonadaceae bacterium]